MGRLAVWLLVMPVIVASGVGCTPLGHCCRQCEAPPEQPGLPLAPAQRTNMDILLQQASANLALHPPPERAQNYRALTAEQCRCRAAQVQDTANMLDAQADDIARQLARPCVTPSKAKELKLKEDILRAYAMEMRNTNAGLGLTLFYRIMETEALTDLQQESLRAISEGVARLRELKERGLKGAEDYEAQRRRELDMQADLGRLKQATDEMNTELARLLELKDVTCNCPSWFWPVFKLHPDTAIPECNTAVADGLKQRPELWMLQRIIDDLDVHTLKVVQQMLSAANGLFGMGDANPVVKCLAQLMAALCDSGPVAREVELRRQQVIEHRESRVVVISGEIRQDVSTLERRAQMIGALRQRVQSQQANFDDLQSKFARGLVSSLQVMEARLLWLNARAEFVKELGLWERAWVQLGLHQGVLGMGCEDPKACGQVNHEISAALGSVLPDAAGH